MSIHTEQSEQKSNKRTPSLVERVKAKAAEAIEAAQSSAASELAIAEAWDSIGFDMQPWIISGRNGIYGDKAAVHFKDIGPDDLVKIMQAFPAIPCITYKDNSNIRYFHPAGARKVPEGATVRECDGFEIEISGGRGFDSFRASWSAMVGNIQTAFNVDLRHVRFLHPRTHRKAVTIGHEFLRYEGPASLVWPEDFKPQWELLQTDSALTAFSYSNTDQSSGDFRIRGGDVLALAQAWEDEANRRNEATKAAFLKDYEAAERLFNLPNTQDIAAQAEKMRGQYNRERLRAGTLEQTAALQTPHALADKAIAEKHWRAYADHYGLDSRQGYFEHYSWACAYLKRISLYEVPMGNGTYKYGHAWL